MTVSTKIAKNLLQIKAIKLNPQNPFTWASGMRSPIYCDNRITLSHPNVRTLIKESFGEISNDFGKFDLVAGVATAGIAHGALLADYLDKPFIYVRAEAKSHGRKNKIEGEIVKGKKALVIEDLISTGGSSIAAARVLEENGISVVGIQAIFNYEFGFAKTNFEEANIPFKTLSGYRDLIKEALDSNYITEEEQNLLADWNADPGSWFEKNYK